jgi:hypothetical protein
MTALEELQLAAPGRVCDLATDRFVAFKFAEPRFG